MPRDDHRAPSRLAGPRLEAGPKLSPPPTRYSVSYPMYDQDEIIENGRDEPLPVTDTRPSDPVMPRMEEPQRFFGAREEDDVPVYEPRQTTNELTKQERHELLMHTIQLYDDEWKLAGIRANEKNNWLIAYLVLRDRRIDLKTALKHQEAMVITIDSQGNTDIREPKKKGVWKSLTSWLTGE